MKEYYLEIMLRYPIKEMYATWIKLDKKMWV
jgi:hypothetical protein